MRKTEATDFSTIIWITRGLLPPFSTLSPTFTHYNFKEKTLSNMLLL